MQGMFFKASLFEITGCSSITDAVKTDVGKVLDQTSLTISPGAKSDAERKKPMDKKFLQAIKICIQVIITTNNRQAEYTWICLNETCSQFRRHCCERDGNRVNAFTDAVTKNHLYTQVYQFLRMINKDFNQ